MIDCLLESRRFCYSFAYRHHLHVLQAFVQSDRLCISGSMHTALICALIITIHQIIAVNCRLNETSLFNDFLIILYLSASDVMEFRFELIVLVTLAWPWNIDCLPCCVSGSSGFLLIRSRLQIISGTQSKVCFSNLTLSSQEVWNMSCIYYKLPSLH